MEFRPKRTNKIDNTNAHNDYDNNDNINRVEHLSMPNPFITDTELPLRGIINKYF